MSGVFEPTRPELDTSPTWDSPTPRVSYVIRATHRSGIGFLARGLAVTLGGTPAEYFSPRQREPLSLRWQAPTSQQYVRALRAHRTSANGVFGLKLHWDHLQELGADTLDDQFPGSTLVHVSRRDIDRQAVSLWIAIQTNEWMREVDGPTTSGPPPRYSFRAIERCRQHVIEGDLGWRRFFNQRGLTPVSVVYEDLVADFEGVIRDVVGQLDPELRGLDVPAPDSVRQADERSEAMAARFARERLGRPALPVPPIMSRVSRRARAAVGVLRAG
jgi:LPS sulfotransferase NodH